MSDRENRTEEPTEKRLHETQEQGQFAKTEELSVIFLLSAIACFMLFYAKDIAAKTLTYTNNIWLNLASFDGSSVETVKVIRELLQCGLAITIGFLGLCFLSAIFSGGIQSGFKLTPKALKFHWERLHPIHGLKRLFSLRKFVEIIIDISKMAAIAWVLYGAFQEIRQDPIFFTPVPFQRIPELFLRIVLVFLSRLIAILLFITLIKYTYERYQTHEDIKMTREEVKEERKQSLGNPEIKAAQRRLAQRLLQKQMMDQIPIADVVVTNPTHFAVALKYERGKDNAPIILAKGENIFAQHIKQIAKNYEVPMVENRLAARLLFRLGSVGKPIPMELYEMIAEILAFVYKTHRNYFYNLKRRRLSYNGNAATKSFKKLE